ncbi:MAG: hypothetical protein Q27BB25_10730 [Blastomonas sp. CACIA14H2]|uniref:hypothetical protein n=1 Tax=Blastomonas sp. CACIA14H2 TaxID=1419876 RepID=UPI0003CFA2A1|nr:MAG: hypothetical protein Q27BB25_10730 [Blastomonas sp. CACIA14H2]
MPDHLDSVKALARSFRKWAAEAVDAKPDTAKSHTSRAEALEALVVEVEDARHRLRPLTTEYGDISDLPPSVVAELNLTKIDELEQQMRDIVASGDGAEVGLDPIIIELWRRHKVSQPRRFIMNKLYRMAQKGIIQSVEGRKGVYMVPKKRPIFGSWDDDLNSDVPF